MRNKYPGSCGDCGKSVASKDGYFERRAGRFVVRCMSCVAKGKVEKGKPLSRNQNEFLNKERRS